MRARFEVCSAQNVILTFAIWLFLALVPVELIGWQAQSCHRFFFEHFTSPFLELLICRNSELVPALKESLKILRLAHYGVLSALHVTLLIHVIFFLFSTRHPKFTRFVRPLLVGLFISIGQGNPSLRFLLTFDFVKTTTRGWLPKDLELFLAAVLTQFSIWTSTAATDWSAYQFSLILTWGAFLGIELSKLEKSSRIKMALWFLLAFFPVSYFAIGNKLSFTLVLIHLANGVLSAVCFIIPIAEGLLGQNISLWIVTSVDALQWRGLLNPSLDKSAKDVSVFLASLVLVAAHMILRFRSLRIACKDETQG